MAPGNSGLLVAGTLSICAAATIWAVMDRRRKQTEEEEEDEDGVEELPPLTREQVIEFFSEAAQRMQEVVMNLTQQIQPLMGKVPEDQLRKVMVDRFEDSLQEYQNRKLEKWDVDEEDLEYVTNTYVSEGDEDVKGCVKMLKMLFESVAGPMEVEPVEIPSDVTVQKACFLIELYFEDMDIVIREALQVLADQGMPMNHPNSQRALAQMVGQRHEQTATAKLQKHGIEDVRMFAAVVEKFQGHPAVAQKLQEGEQKQHAALQSFGLQF